MQMILKEITPNDGRLTFDLLRVTIYCFAIQCFTVNDVRVLCFSI
jgi:hypothetical protein